MGRQGSHWLARRTFRCLHPWDHYVISGHVISGQEGTKTEFDASSLQLLASFQFAPALKRFG